MYSTLDDSSDQVYIVWLVPQYCAMQETLCIILQDNCTALIIAAGEGHTDVVQLLLCRQDLDLNMRNEVC